MPLRPTRVRHVKLIIVRQRTLRRGSRQAVIGGGLLAVAVAVASCVGALAGGSAPAHRTGQPADPIRASADAASLPDPPRVGAIGAPGALGAADPVNLTGAAA